jgi:hypothetical protein
VTRFALRIELRHARRWIASIVLLALAGGAAIAAAQAARRTDTAFARALSEGRASDAIVNANTFGATPARTRALTRKGLQILATINSSPLVVAHGVIGGANLFLFRNGHLDPAISTDSFGTAAFDADFGHSIAVPHVQSGRLARPDRPDEITINRAAAKATGWHSGTRVTDLRVYDNDELVPESGSPSPDRGTRLSMLVVGVADRPEDLLVSASQREPRVYLTPAFTQRFSDSVFFLTDSVKLRHGRADLPALRELVATANRAAPEIDMPIAPTVEGLIKVNRANDPLVNGLWILAALTALVGMLLAAQSLGRSFSARIGDHAQLRALGATRRERFATEFATLTAVAFVAALLATAIGFALSPMSPVGAAREVEPHRGLSFDFALLAAAAGLAFVGTLAAALPAVVRLAVSKPLPGPGSTGPMEGRSRLADIAAVSGLAPAAVVGTRLALQPGRGVSATPVRSVMLSLTLVFAAVTATFAFGVNLQRWTSTPRLYGWNWDVAAGSAFGAVPPNAIDGLAHFPNVAAASGLTVGELRVGGRSIPAIGISPVRGTVAPLLTAGRLPSDATQIVLGAKTMRALHTHVGAVLNAAVDDKPIRLTVVGETAFPRFGSGRFGETGLGVGALGTTSLFRVNDPATEGGRFNYLLIRFKAGTATSAAPRLRAAVAEQGCADAGCVLVDSRPPEIDGYRNARGLPLAIGIALALLLAATLSHVLITTMRRRAADLAILRALGCTPRELVATLRWQALVLTGTAVVIGIPVGLIGARFAWSAFTDQFGVSPGTVVPTGMLTLATACVLLLASLLASAVGLRVPNAARVHQLSS